MNPAELLAQALPQPAAPGGPRLEPGGRLGDFRLIDEIGRGGMGIVFTALAGGSHRIVALKVPHLASEALARRFRTEAEAVAALDHRGILPIYEAGEIDGLPYFTMKFAEAGSLAERLAEFTGAPRRAAALLAAAAEALQHAHERGLLHRDLKPQNILLQPGAADGELEPLIADFGLARWLDRESDLTHSQAVLGTPGYLAPEALRGARGATIAGDVFSLGAILYHVLTGQPPFAGNSVAETLHRVAEAAVPPPRQLAPDLPRDLEAICLRCLEAEPARRYASAGELAADLRRFLAGQPVAARHPHAAERLWRWARRSPVLAGLSVALLAALAGLGWALIDNAASRDAALRSEARRAETAERIARERLRASLLATAEIARVSGRSGQRFRALTALREAWAIQPGAEIRHAAIACLALPDVATERTVPIQTRGGAVAFDPAHPQRGAFSPAPGLVALGDLATGQETARWGDPAWPIATLSRFSPDGRHLAAIGENGQLRVWDVEARRVVLERPLPKPSSSVPVPARPFDFTAPDRLAVADPAGGVAWFDLATGDETQRLPTPQPAVLLAGDPTGTRLAVAGRNSRQVEVYDVATQTLRETWKTASFVSALGWSPDGRQLAAGSLDKTIYLWEPDAAPLHLHGHSGAVADLRFNPAGTVLASSATDGSIRLWQRGRETELLDCEFSSDPGTPLSWSPDGQRLSCLAFGRRQLAVFRLEMPAAATLLSVPDGERLVESQRNIDLSADGALLATVTDQGARVWDVALDREIAHFPKDRGEWLGARFAGPQLWVCGWNSGLRSHAAQREGDHWTLTPPAKLAAPRLSGATLCEVAGDHRLAFLHGNDQCFLLADPAQLGRPLVLHQPAPYALALSPDGRWAATSSYRGEGIRLWSLPDGKPVRELAGGARVLAPAFSPDSRWLVLPGNHGAAVWQVGSWQRTADLPCSERIDAIAFAPGGRTVAIQTPRDLRLLRFPGGEELARFAPPGPAGRSTSGSFAFRADGRQLAVQSASGGVVVWDLPTLHQHLRELGMDWEE